MEQRVRDLYEKEMQDYKVGYGWAGGLAKTPAVGSKDKGGGHGTLSSKGENDGGGPANPLSQVQSSSNHLLYEPQRKVSEDIRAVWSEAQVHLSNPA